MYHSKIYEDFIVIFAGAYSAMILMQKRLCIRLIQLYLSIFASTQNTLQYDHRRTEGNKKQ
jgi:hypothetical protein